MRTESDMRGEVYLLSILKNNIVLAMKKLLFFLSCISALFSCGETTKQEVKSFWDQCDVIAKREVVNGDTVIVCDSKLVKQKKNIPLDLLVDSFEIIKMDNKREEALISKRFPNLYFTENYIGVTAYSYFPMKLFRKDGTFVRHIGARGQGPGEYTVIDAIDMDEKNDRIYILPFSADYILVYDFKGNIYPRIKLAESLLYGSTIKVYGDKKQVLVTKPISPDTNYCVWIQDFEGNLIQGAKTSDYYKDVTSFSESTITHFRTDAIELFRFGVLNGNEFLYHYDIENNRLIPQFRIDGDDQYIFIHELPNHFVVEKAQSTGTSDNDLFTEKLIVDKKTLRGCYFDGFETASGLILGNYCILNQVYGPNFAVLDFSSKVSEYIQKIKEESLTSTQKQELQKLKSIIAENDANDECSILFRGKFKK